MPSASATSSTPRATAAEPWPRLSSASASSARTVLITSCVSGSWKSDARVRRRAAAGPCSRVSRPASVTRPAKRPPWKCGTSPQAARSSVDLPAPESPASRQNSPGRDVEVDVAQRGALGARVAVGDLLEAQQRRSRLDPPAVGERQQRGDEERDAERERSGAERACTSGRRRSSRCRRAAPRAPARAQRARSSANARSWREHGARCARGARRARREAAHLERRGDVQRAIERRRRRRAQISARRPRAPRRPPSGRVRCASARRCASAASTGIMRVASEAVSAERNDSRRRMRSVSSGSTARLASVVTSTSSITFSAITAP